MPEKLRKAALDAVSAYYGTIPGVDITIHEAMTALNEALTPAPVAAPSAPAPLALPQAREGWQWVPVEPTPEMLQEVYIQAAVSGLDDEAICEIWGAMVEAAPSAPAQEDGRGETDVGAMEYQGNTVSFIKAYGDEITRCWGVLHEAGIAVAGKPLHEVLRAALAPAPAAPSLEQGERWYCRNCEGFRAHERRGVDLCCTDCASITASREFATQPAAPVGPDNLRERFDAWTDAQLDEIASAIRDACGPATGARARAILATQPAAPVGQVSGEIHRLAAVAVRECPESTVFVNDWIDGVSDDGLPVDRRPRAGMSTAIVTAGPWEIYSRMSKSSSNTVYLVCRTVTRDNGRQETEFLTNHGPATRPLRRRASCFRSEAAARAAIAKATGATP